MAASSNSHEKSNTNTDFCVLITRHPSSKYLQTHILFRVPYNSLAPMLENILCLPKKPIPNYPEPIKLIS